MKRLLLICSILLFSSTIILARENDETIKKNEFGFNAGFTTGIGFSYRRWFNNVGVQLTGIPYKFRYEFMGCIGLSGLYTIKETERIKAFVFLGNQVWNEKTTHPDSDHTRYDILTIYRVGTGPGISFGETIKFNLMVGYAGHFEDYVWRFYPTIEMGWYYPF